jgi:pyruvate,water dikinase
MKRTWDNANIVESYPGVCSPLTFSFARHVYAGVYKQFALLWGKSPEFLQANTRTFDQFLGYIDGRFYYHLEVWCELISQLPGFGGNPKALQEMMGVLPEDQVVLAKRKSSLTEKLAMVSRLIRFHFLLNSKTNFWLMKFHQDFQHIKRQLADAKSGEELIKVYIELEQTFLNHWQAPILNDFFVMIYATAAKRFYKKLHHQELPANLLGGIGISGNAKLVDELQRLAKELKTKKLWQQLSKVSDAQALATLLRSPTYGKRLKLLFDTYGFRNSNDLKLESPNLNEEPEQFIGLIRQYASTDSMATSQSGFERPRSVVLRFLIKLAKRAIRNREEMRLCRSQIFGVVRQIFIRIGRDLQDRLIVEKAEDIFFLEIEEIIRFYQGSGTLKHLSVLIDQRRRELATASERLLRPHFQTEGFVFFEKTRLKTAETRKGTLMGRANFPGVVSGEVLIMKTIDLNQDVRGKILVCQSTDPNWVPFFGLIKGLVVERGGILSHAAIVSRELQVPSVIGVAHATSSLKNGQLVTLNSIEGRIYV